MKWLFNIFRIDLDTTNRVFGLDILRTISILMVVETHGYHLLQDYGPNNFSLFPCLDKIVISFVLSGYLIGSFLIKTYNSPDFKFKKISTFWIRRWLRTVPTHFIVITALVLLRYSFTTVGFHFPWQHYLFLQNFYSHETDTYYFYPEGWSLSIEEWFYFLIPALILIAHYLFRNFLSKKQLILSVIISVIMASTLLRLYKAYTAPDDTMYMLNINVTRIVLYRLDTLMYGVLAAFIRYYYWDQWIKFRKPLFYASVALMAATLAAYLYFLHHLIWVQTFYFTQVAIIVAMSLPQFAEMRFGKGFWLKFVTYFSKISFCIYLLNRTPILKSMMQVFPAHNLTMAAIEYVIFWILVLVSATLFHKYVEKPVLDFREKVSPSEGGHKVAT